MKFFEYKYLVLSDLYRVTENIKLTTLATRIFKGGAYSYIFWMRTCEYTKNNNVLKFTVYPIAHILLKHLHYKYGLAIPYKTSIGSGFSIAHIGGIVINSQCVIGKNLTLSHDVTLGRTNRGSKKGCPVIGDNVYIGPGAKIIGHIRIGNNVAIGANCVVTKDIPDYAVVVGIPGKIISTQGSDGYVERIEYETLLNGQ